MKLLEVCAATLGSCYAAKEAKANRVELCSALEVGGLTPSLGLIKAAVQLAKGQMAVRVLIRLRPGDFCYTKEDVDVMCEDIRVCAREGVDGVVVGALTPEGDLDVAAVRRMVEAWGKKGGLTFHRAFDRCANPLAVLEQIIDLGFDTLLTSGQEPKAPQGKALLKQLHVQAAGRIQIMAGSGVSSQNARMLLEETDADVLHLSASKKILSPAKGGESLGSVDYSQSDAREIERVLAEITAFENK